MLENHILAFGTASFGSKVSNGIFNSEDINKNNLDGYMGIIEKEPSNIIDFIDRETILVIDELEDCKKFANNWYLDSESNFNNCVYELNENLKGFIEKKGFKKNFEKCINNKEIEDFVLNDRIEGASKFKLWKWLPHYLKWYFYLILKKPFFVKIKSPIYNSIKTVGNN